MNCPYDSLFRIAVDLLQTIEPKMIVDESLRQTVEVLLNLILLFPVSAFSK